MKGHSVPYLPQELAWIEAHKELPRAEAHALFCAYWGRDDVSLTCFNALCKRKGWMTGRTGCFTKGLTPHNKGKPMPAEVKEKCIGTAFKSGHVPHNYRGPGSEFMCPKDGYVYVIIADDKARTKTKTRRVLKHKHLWEQTNGPVPAGHALKCMNDDKTDCRPENWQAVPRACLPRLAGGNRYRKVLPFDGAPAELKPSILAVARLEHAAREARRRA
ncbi:HNH endonuclease signature motif containing protein [Paracoccus sp. 22332]|uniref:HNH endonuclease signature motif containing protein n=1 Tax=Paracoccus sp. 22332 TaxID=3453913 RepID=UPI003F87F720